MSQELRIHAKRMGKKSQVYLTNHKKTLIGFSNEHYQFSIMIKIDS